MARVDILPATAQKRRRRRGRREGRSEEQEGRSEEVAEVAVAVEVGALVVAVRRRLAVELSGRRGRIRGSASMAAVVAV